jgi:hypothetical protein
MRILIRFQIQGFYVLKLTKLQFKKAIFFYHKLQFTYPQASIKDVQAIGKAFSPQKRTSCTSKLEISYLFLFLRVIFALLDLDRAAQNQCGSESGTETLLTAVIFCKINSKKEQGSMKAVKNFSLKKNPLLKK